MRCSALCSAGIAKLQSNGVNDILDDDESRSLLLHLGHSLIPEQFHTAGSNTARQSDPTDTEPSKLKNKYKIPTNRELRRFAEWFFQFVNAGDRRREAIQRNVALGASAAVDSPTPATTHNRYKRKQQESTPRHAANEKDMHDLDPANFDKGDSSSIPSASNLIDMVKYLSPYYDDDPQLFLNEGIDVIQSIENITPLEQSIIFLAMTRYALLLNRNANNSCSLTICAENIVQVTRMEIKVHFSS
jgi:hypothetical protein